MREKSLKWTKAQIHNFTSQHSNSCKTVMNNDIVGSRNHPMAHKNISDIQTKHCEASLVVISSFTIFFLPIGTGTSVAKSCQPHATRSPTVTERSHALGQMIHRDEGNKKKAQKLSRQGGWSKWNMTISSYQQPHYYSLKVFYILMQEKEKTSVDIWQCV